MELCERPTEELVACNKKDVAVVAVIVVVIVIAVVAVA